MKNAILLVLLVCLSAAGYDTCAEGIQSVQPVLLPRPPFEGAIAPLDVWAEPLGLVEESSQRNEITDDAAWFERHGFRLPTLTPPNPFRGLKGDLPRDVPTKWYDLMLVRAIESPDALFLFFGNHFGDAHVMFSLDPGTYEVRQAWDFSNYSFAPENVPDDLGFVFQSLQWAWELDGTVYVSHFHRTYASSSMEMNGYITALDAETGELVWRTEPLVCNSQNFLLLGDVIVCGYGFTEEPDYVYQLNRHTGETIARTPTRTAPDYLFEKDGRLYVRCYDTDYVFGMENR